MAGELEERVRYERESGTRELKRNRLFRELYSQYPSISMKADPHQFHKLIRHTLIAPIIPSKNLQQSASRAESRDFLRRSNTSLRCRSVPRFTITDPPRCNQQARAFHRSSATFMHVY